MLAERRASDLTVNAFDMDYAWNFTASMNKIAKGEMSAKTSTAIYKDNTIYPCGVYKMNFITTMMRLVERNEF